MAIFLTFARFVVEEACLECLKRLLNFLESGVALLVDSFCTKSLAETIALLGGKRFELREILLTENSGR
jgi:hypothetical protein